MTKKTGNSLTRGLLLLIDDEEVIRDIGGEMLESLGFSCITAPDGVEGIKLYNENKANIRLVVLDVELPGLSGEKVYETLRTINPDIKILLVSGYGKEYLEK
ncbi:MAG: response regulator, partial [Acidobacteria bacterium]|nr:response regulator [Acidobacteriota bacterium]